MTHRSSPYERKVFQVAVAAAVGLHLLVIIGLIVVANAPAEPKFKPLAVMDFAYYDPEGGEPDGGKGEEPSTGPTPGMDVPTGRPEEEEPEIAETPPEPETSLIEEVPEPEVTVEPEPSESTEVVTSTSEEAAPPPPPIKAAEVKKQPKPKPKQKAKPKAAPKTVPKAKSTTDGGSGGGALPGEVKPGGGKGKGRGGVGGGQGIGNPNALNAYAAKIRAKLNRLKKYPPAAAAKQIGGVTTVNFTVNRQGTVISSRLVKSSGNSALDQEAMALLKRCSPFSAMPKELAQNTISLTVPINFNPPRR